MQKWNEIWDTLRKDSVMVGLESKYGKLELLEESSDLFADIVDAIVSQQLSVKAAKTIYERLKKLSGRIEVENIRALDETKMRECGISRPKIGYIKGLAEAVATGGLDLESLRKMNDQEVEEELVKLKGVGKWTAEMLLIFSLAREDIFSIGDLGIRNAMAALYGVGKENLDLMEQMSQRWRPYRSYASRYLWKSLENTG